MSDFAKNVARASRHVKTWPFSQQRAWSSLTPDELDQSADDLENTSNSPAARRLLAREMRRRNIKSLGPRELVALWDEIRPC